MTLGSFTEKDKKDYGTNGVDFGKPYATPYLKISFIKGEIEYDRGERNRSATDLAKDVPATNQLFQLTTNFLQKLGISLSEVARKENGGYNIRLFNDIGGVYFDNGRTITNITAREVSVNRAVDGMEFKCDGGYGLVRFGEYGQVVKAQFYWRSVERDKLYAAATREQIIQWVREGKAIQKHMMTEQGGEAIIDWSTVKSLTIRKAAICYWGEAFAARELAHQPVLPSLVYPYVEISGTVDTGRTNLYVEIVCPVIDETN
jgi:hypothetical protein